MNKFLVGSLVAMGVAAVIGYYNDEPKVITSKVPKGKTPEPQKAPTQQKAPKASEAPKQPEAKSAPAGPKVKPTPRKPDPVSPKTKRVMKMGPMSYFEYMDRVSNLANLVTPTISKGALVIPTVEAPKETHSLQNAMLNKSRKPIVTENIKNVLEQARLCDHANVEECTIDGMSAWIVTLNHKGRTVVLSITWTAGAYNFQWLTTDGFLINTVPLASLDEERFTTDIGSYITSYANMIDLL